MLDRLPTRKRAAEVAGKNQDTITAWSRGEGLGQFQALAAVAAEAGVSLDWLVFGDTPATVPSAAEVTPEGMEQLAAVAVEATMEWLDANDLELSGRLTARLIGKSLKALMALPDGTQRNLHAEVKRVLDDGLEFLRSAG